MKVSTSEGVTFDFSSQQVQGSLMIQALLELYHTRTRYLIEIVLY